MSGFEGQLRDPADPRGWPAVVRVVLRLGIATGVLAAVAHPGVRGGFVDALWETPVSDVVVMIGLGVLLLVVALVWRVVAGVNRQKLQRIIDEHVGRERGDGEVS